MCSAHRSSSGNRYTNTGNRNTCIGRTSIENRRSRRRDRRDTASKCISTLSPDQEGKFEKLLEKKPHLFAEKDIELGSTGVKKCAMKTTEAYPMRQKASRILFMKRPQVEKHVHSMLEAGVIRPSTSPWASPIVLVPKRGSEETRFCVDFRRVNSVTVQNSYPLPNIDEILAAFCGAKYFSKMDLKARYWQIEMEEESKPKPRS